MWPVSPESDRLRGRSMGMTPRKDGEPARASAGSTKRRDGWLARSSRAAGFVPGLVGYRPVGRAPIGVASGLETSVTREDGPGTRVRGNYPPFCDRAEGTAGLSERNGPRV